MPTNLALNDELITEAQRLGQHKSKKDAVNAALEEYVNHLRRLAFLELEGTIDFDPDYDYIWWTSENAGEGIALNFARNKDPEIDAALKQGRASTDIETRKQAYATVQRKINEDIPYIWYDRAQWAVVAANNVRGITNGPLPDGSPANPMGGPGGFGGITFLTQTWLAS